MTSAENVPRAILVATDGSDAARRAFEAALEIADQCGGVVHLLTVVDTTATPVAFGVADVHDLEDAKERLIEDALAIDGDHAVDVTGAVRRGHPATRILEYVEENEIDLIAMGRTSRSSVSEAIVGSTTDRIIRTASVPVLVVPADTDDERS